MGLFALLNVEITTYLTDQNKKRRHPSGATPQETSDQSVFACSTLVPILRPVGPVLSHAWFVHAIDDRLPYVLIAPTWLHQSRAHEQLPHESITRFIAEPSEFNAELAGRDAHGTLCWACPPIAQACQQSPPLQCILVFGETDRPCFLIGTVRWPVPPSSGHRLSGFVDLVMRPGRVNQDNC